MIPTKDFISKAQAFEAANNAYTQSPAGREEIKAKRALTDAYLKCNASDKEKREALSYLSQQTIRNILDACAWQQKHSTIKGKTISLAQLDEAVAQYQEALDKAEKTPEFETVTKTAAAYRKSLEDQRNQCTTNLRDALKNAGISNERILHRTTC